MEICCILQISTHSETHLKNRLKIKVHTEHGTFEGYVIHADDKEIEHDSLVELRDTLQSALQNNRVNGLSLESCENPEEQITFPHTVLTSAVFIFSVVSMA